MSSWSKLNEARRLQARGDLTGARNLCVQVLQVDPRNAGAATLLGDVCTQAGAAVEAMRAYTLAIGLNDRDASVFAKRAILRRRLGQTIEALSDYNRSVELAPDEPTVHYNKAILLKAMGRRDEAIASNLEAIRLHPRYAQAHFNIAILFHESRQFEAAALHYGRALETQPEDPGILFNAAISDFELGRFEECESKLQRVLRKKPGSRDTILKIGVAQAKGGKLSEAMETFRLLEERDASDVEATYNRALLLYQAERYEEAKGALQGVLEKSPNFARAWHALGASFRQSGELGPAIEFFREALSRDPQLYDANWDLAVTLLQAGRFAEGWQQYEWRRRAPNSPVPTRIDHVDPWLPHTSLSGKRVLVVSEQGAGDTIQFCRYASHLSRVASEVHVQVQPHLVSLLQCIEGVRSVSAIGTAPPEVDAWVPMMSLPFALNLHGPLECERYIFSSSRTSQDWAAHLPHAGAKKRVGFVWKGAAENSNDRFRSISLQQFVGGLKGNHEFISLQKPCSLDERDFLQEKAGIPALGDRLGDFADTAAVLEKLDLVVCVDTAVVHLAGAMGKPAWLLLSFIPHWPWGLSGETTPWYPSVRLFRQGPDRDWGPVLSNLGDALSSLNCA